MWQQLLLTIDGCGDFPSVVMPDWLKTLMA